MTCESPSVERSYEEMVTARGEWMRAYKELKEALAVSQTLNLTQYCNDEDALNNARLRELGALEKYIAAVNLHHDAVLLAGVSTNYLKE